jgi:hypothetical protein
MTFEEEFKSVVTQWYNETCRFSTYEDIYSNHNFLKIIGFGKKAIQKEPSWLLVALKHITGENHIPNTDKYARHLQNQIDCWLKWSKLHYDLPANTYLKHISGGIIRLKKMELAIGVLEVGQVVCQVKNGV